MQMILERHNYAPELNTVHIIRGGSIPVPGALTLAEARHRLFMPTAPRILASVSRKYPAPYTSLSTTITGWVDSRAQALKVAKQWRKDHTGGALYNGDTLPAPVVTVTTKLVG